MIGFGKKLPMSRKIMYIETNSSDTAGQVVKEYNENLRLLGGKPLVCHIVTAIIHAENLKADIYINSDSKEIEEIAHDLSWFYQDLLDAKDNLIKDNCVNDFIRILRWILFQFSPRSPLSNITC